MRREVRCCCDAGKLLGSMEVPENLRGKFVAGPGLELEVAPFVSGTQLVIEQLLGVRLRQDLAIKSNDYPMEELKKIPSFEEAK